MIESGAPRRSVSLSRDRLEELLDVIDRDRSGRKSGSSVDTQKSLQYRVPDLSMAVEHPGGGRIECSVPSREISVTAISFLYGGFLYAGTSCEINLPTNWNTEEAVSGCVSECTHVQGQVHHVDFLFDEPIDLKKFIKNSKSLAGILARDTAPEKLSGTVLLLASNGATVRIIEHYLESSGAKLKSYTERGTALDWLRQNHCDLLLINPESAAGNGSTTFEQARELGYCGPVVVLAAEPNPRHLGELLQREAHEIIQMPCDELTLMGAISPLLSGSGRSNEPDAIFSTLLVHDKDARLLSDYVEIALGLAHKLKRAVQADELDETRRLCNSLRETGGCYGFEIVSDRAKEAMIALDASFSIAESNDALQNLLRTVERIQPTIRATPRVDPEPLESKAA